MDRLSTIRGFEEAFGVKEEEVAIRFYKMLSLSPKASDPRTYHPSDPASKLAEERYAAYEVGQDIRYPSRIKILRFYAAMQDFLDVDDQIHTKMAFNFYDYDNNGNIGSVDIINLKRHFTFENATGYYKTYEDLLKTFEEDRVNRTIKSSLQYVIKGSDRKALFVKEKPKRKEYKKNKDFNATLTSG